MHGGTEMKKILMCIFCGFYFVGAFAASSTTMYIGTEQKYIFTAENLAQTIPEFVENEKKQEKMADTYAQIMNQETGAVSVANLFEVCRAGGFNTYRQTGYDQCREFILKLLENAEQEIEEGFLSGFCPAAYDENGKQQNGLKSIDENTRIGDFCSSTNIAGGEVVFRKGYNCTCRAFACNAGYESKGGACVTIIADGNGNCLRKEYTGVTSLPDGVLKFCESKSPKGCKVTNGISNYNGERGKVVCNATQYEFDMAKASMLRNKDNKIAALKYYEVCGQHRGKTGKKEYCVEDMFKSINVGRTEAVGLMELYAQEKHNLTIYCEPKAYRTQNNDDYMKCATLDKSTYYEFRFDDVVESSDSTKRDDLFKGLMLLYNVNTKGGAPIHHFKGKCTPKIENAAKKFGWKATYRPTMVGWPGDYCYLSPAQLTTQKNLSSKLRTIEGLNSNIGINIQTQGTTDIRNKLLGHIKGQGFIVTAFDCDRSYGNVYKGGLSGDDNILTCYLSGTFNGKRYNKQPVDFVFDDVSEGKKYMQNSGDRGLDCVGVNGNFDGHYCRGLTESECIQLEREMLAELKKYGYTGKGDLVDWDEAAGACELNDAQIANNINKAAKYTAIVGLTVAGAFTGGTTTAAAVSMMAVELAGIAGEMYTERKKELLPQEWANQFLTASRGCKSASCAENTLRENFGKISQASDKLNKDVLSQVDNELARLAELIPESRLEQIMADPKAPDCWDTWECQSYIFMGMQMASLGVGVGKGLVKLTRVIGRKAGAAVAKNSSKALALTKVKAGNATNALVKAGENADDAAKGFADAARAAGKADGAADATKAANKAADAAQDAAKAANKADDIIYDAAYFSKNTSGTGDVFKGADGMVQINRKGMSATTLKDLMKKAKQYGFECSECGGDVLKFSKSADNVADATKTANNAADAARGASKADDVSDAAKGAGKGTSDSGRAASGASDASKGGKAAGTTSKTSRAANLYEDWKVFGKGKNYEFDFGVLENNESELLEFIEMVKKDGYLVVLKGNKVSVKEVFSDLLERATTGIGSPHASKDLLSATKWEELNNQISHQMLKYVDEGDGTMKLSFDASKGAKGFVGDVGRHRVFLEKLPTASGGSSEVVNIADRAVVVVNVDGHRIPFYVSSGQAGKDALGIPSGKWYPIAGIGKDGEGWFNKMPDMMNNPVPELDRIVSKLESQFDPQLLKKYALNGKIPDAHGSAGRIINSEFKNGVVPEIKSSGQSGVGYMNPKYQQLFDANIQHIIDIFR